MKPYYVAVQDGDDYRHLVAHIKSEQDLIDFKELVADLILEATEYFDEFRNMSSDDILCYRFLKLLYSFKAMDEVFFSANRDHKPEIIKLESLDTLDEFKCTIQYGGQKISSTFYLVPAKGNLMRVSAITLDKEVYNNRITRNRETTYPIDAQGYAFRISVSQNNEPKTTVNHNIRLTKTIYGTTDDPITRNRLCHELKLFVHKYNVVTNDPPTVKIIP